MFGILIALGYNLEYRTPAEVYTSGSEADVVQSRGTLTIMEGVEAADPDLSMASILSN
ncbi:MAG: hypothetical protein HYX93_06215 [Chloroflexi bacterium]|nr:hypothetical protein [Chloroflexota bacterium]